MTDAIAWRPIAEAPHDYSPILLCRDRNGYQTYFVGHVGHDSSTPKTLDGTWLPHVTHFAYLTPPEAKP